MPSCVCSMALLVKVFYPHVHRTREKTASLLLSGFLLAKFLQTVALPVTRHVTSKVAGILLCNWNSTILKSPFFKISDFIQCNCFPALCLAELMFPSLMSSFSFGKIWFSQLMLFLPSTILQHAVGDFITALRQERFSVLRQTESFYLYQFLFTIVLKLSTLRLEKFNISPISSFKTE